MTFRGGYQRSPAQGGRTFDTGPPRTNTGLTGLGAVGGATGVGAGALRVIVEFLTQYDSKELERLEKELTRLQRAESRNNRILSNEMKLQSKEQGQLTRLENLRGRAKAQFTTAERKELKVIQDLERSRQRGQIKEANQRKALLAQSTGFSKGEITSLVRQDQLRRRIDERREKAAKSIANAETRIKTNQQQQLPLVQRLTGMQNLRAQVGPKLGALALGAVGGVFGGAVVGLGFAAAQGLIEAVGQGLKDIFDPANKAREALEGVVDEINKLAEKEGLTFLEAAKIHLRDFGEAGKGIDVLLLAQAAATQVLTERNKELAAILGVVQHANALHNEQVKEAIRLQGLSQGIGGFGSNQASQASINRIAAAAGGQDVQLTSQEQRILDAVLKDVEQSANAAATAAARLAAEERATAAAAQIASYAQDRFAASIQRVAGMRITGLQDQLSALSDAGPSARTQGIQNQLEGIAEASQQAAYASQLQGIQEQRALILLEQRIRFQGQSIRMDQLSARGQMVAIDARIEALQRAGIAEQNQLDALNDLIKAARKADQEQDKRDSKALKVFDDKIAAINEQGEAQDRLNQLLDLQFRMSQGIERNEGESIQEFIQRRANEQRGMLAEQDSLQRATATDAIAAERDRVAAIQEVANAKREQVIEAQELEAEQLQATIARIEKARAAEIQALNDQKARLQLEVQLQDLAEQEKQLASQETTRQRTKDLQEQLAASQKADQEALESRRKTLEDQIKAEEKKVEDALRWTEKEEQERLRLAIAGARTYADVQAIIGQVAGAKRALAELEAYVRAHNIPGNVANPILDPLRQLIEAANAKLGNIIYNSLPTRAGPTPMAEGGMFTILKNSNNNPFGANIRAGERGDEIGMVLSNRVARALKESQGDRLPPIQLTVNKSDDPWRDAQRSKRMIKETVEDLLL